MKIELNSMVFSLEMIIKYNAMFYQLNVSFTDADKTNRNI